MWQIISGSLLLSLVHAAIPNHWLPISAIAKSEGWTMRETMKATLLIGAAHILSTIIVGMLIGVASFQLTNLYSEIIHWGAPCLLFVLGVAYVIADFVNKKHNHNHFDNIEQKQKSKKAIIGAMVLAMFFSPCIELDVYFIPASLWGIECLLAVSATYLVVTVSVMMVLVALVTKGLNKINWHWFEHKQKTITGAILIIMAIVLLSYDHQHHHHHGDETHIECEHH